MIILFFKLLLLVPLLWRGVGVRLYLIETCSAIGPKASDGKNDSAATINITAKIITPKVAVSVLSVPADSGINFLLASIPAMATGPMIGKNRPRKMTKPVLTFQKILLAVSPAYPEPLLAEAELYWYSISENP